MHQDASYRWQTLGDTIRDLEHDCGECAAFGEDRLSFLKLVPEGGNWRDLPVDLKQMAMGGAFESGGGKVGFTVGYLIISPLLHWLHHPYKRQL